jgi:hypothetical protein
MRAPATLLAAMALLAPPSAAATNVVTLDARGYVDVGGGAWLPQGDLARQGSAAPGWAVQFGVGPKRLPFTLGLGAGVVTTASRTDPGPTGVWVHDDTIDFGPTTIGRAVELRHVELVLRLEPDWARLRPFLEATGGVFQSWTVTTMTADWTGGVLDAREDARGWTPAYGLGGGLVLTPFRPLQVGPRADGTGGGSIAVALTLGVRVVRGGELAVATPESPDGSSTMLSPARAALAAVAPYALLTFAFRSADPK